MSGREWLQLRQRGRKSARLYAALPKIEKYTWKKKKSGGKESGWGALYYKKKCKKEAIIEQKPALKSPGKLGCELRGNRM